MRKLLRVDQVAEVLNISQSMVYKLVENGSLPHLRIGRAIRVVEAELEAWIEEQKSIPEPEITFQFPKTIPRGK